MASPFLPPSLSFPLFLRLSFPRWAEEGCIARSIARGTACIMERGGNDSTGKIADTRDGRDLHPDDCLARVDMYLSTGPPPVVVGEDCFPVLHPFHTGVCTRYGSFPFQRGNEVGITRTPFLANARRSADNKAFPLSNPWISNRTRVNKVRGRSGNLWNGRIIDCIVVEMDRTMDIGCEGNK